MAAQPDDFYFLIWLQALTTNSSSIRNIFFIGERISPTLNLVRSPDAVFATLETLGHVPLRMRHSDGEFTRMAESADSVFPKESAEINAPKTARQVRVSRVVTVSYQFPDAESFDAIQKMLAELRCPFHADSKTRIVSIQQKEQPRFDDAVEKLQGNLIIEIDQHNAQCVRFFTHYAVGRKRPHAFPHQSLNRAG